MSNEAWDELPRWRVPFNWRAFGRKNSYLIRTTGQLGRRLGRMSAFMGLYAANQLTWAADQFIAPNWDRVVLNGPIFIIGHQRSGTTLLHRTLASDPNAIAMTLGEMLLPAVSARRMSQALWRWDARRGDRLRKRVDAFQAKRLAGLDDIHHVRIDKIEEDEFVLLTVYRSGMAINSTPAVAADPELNRLRDFSTWTESERRAALGWYRACLMKAAYSAEAEGPNPDRWIVGKNPAFSQRVPDLLKVFPNARFIHLVRNPVETIPSRLSLVQAIWELRQPAGAKLSQRETDEVVADSIRTYMIADRDLRALPPEKAITILFDELTTDLPGSLDRIYRQLRLPGSPPVVGQARADGPGAGTHRYSLDEFGISEATLRAKMKPVFDRYGF